MPKNRIFKISDGTETKEVEALSFKKAVKSFQGSSKAKMITIEWMTKGGELFVKDQKIPLGRKKESNTDRGKQENAFGKDPLGRKDIKGGDDDAGRLRPKFRGGSPLAMEHKEMLKKAPGPKRTGKKLVFEQEKRENKLLDESQLKE